MCHCTPFVAATPTSGAALFLPEEETSYEEPISAQIVGRVAEKDVTRRHRTPNTEGITDGIGIH